MLLSLKACTLAFTHRTPFFKHLPCKLKSHFFTISFSGFFPKPQILSPFTSKFSTTMSSKRPSAFDVLMANASKKKNPQEKPPSPKKRKADDSNSTKNQDLVQIQEAQIEITPQETVKVAKVTTKSSGVGASSEILPNSVEKGGAQNEKEVLDGDLVVKKPKLIVSPDESVGELKKKAANFDPKKAGYWGKGEKVPFMFLAKTLDVVSKEKGRIATTEILCNMLRTVIESTPEDLLAVVYLLANKIAPAHEGLELGIGETSIIKALAEACGAKEAHIKKQYKELGDLGLVAKASRSSQPLMRKPEPLTVTKVFNTFRIIAKESGKDSQEKKKNHIKGLLVAATDCEPQYLIRLLQTNLRIGSAGQTLLVALGHAAVYAEKHSLSKDVDSPLEEAAKIVKKVYSVIPVYEKIIPALLAEGVWNLPKTCTFSPGVPVGPMLAKATKGVSEILDKFQDTEFTCEYKYDGERAQIHFLENGSVEIYSRNAERNTGKYPDVVETITRLKVSSVTSFVLDCELVAYDREKKKILPFQVLSSRARKNVVMEDIKIAVCIYAFDILYLDGQTLMPEQLHIRRELLYKSFKEEPGFFQFATAITSNDLEVIQKFLEAAVDASCEGLIIKTLKKDATYEPTKRSLNWLKLKKDYMESIGDSLDLVPIAAFHGRGKRTGVYGAFLLACYDADSEEFQSICKIGTGFSEVMLEERSASLRPKVISNPKSYYRYSDTINPDVWFEPSEVWEVKAADLTISPVHRAAIGIVDSDKGISLRFPRLLRVREDKTPEQASSSEMVADMYKSQKHTQDVQDEEDDE